MISRRRATASAHAVPTAASCSSDLLGMHDRRTGIRFAFGSLIYVQFMFGIRLYGEMAGPSFEINRFMHLSLSFMLVVPIVALMIHGRRDPRLTFAL